MGLHEGATAALTEIIADVVARVEAKGWPALCMADIVPGSQAALDYCDRCDGGMVWGRVVDITAAADPGSPAAACGMPWNVSIELGMVRGAPVMHEDGEPPTPEEQAAAAAQQQQETDLMFASLSCIALTSGWRVQPMAYAPIGPEGLCVGGVWIAVLEVI